MSRPTSSVPPANDTIDVRSTPRSHAGLTAAGVGSLLAGTLAAWWSLSPGDNPLADSSLVLISAWLSPTTVSMVAIVAGALGAVTTVVVLVRPARRPTTALTLVAVTQVAVYGFALQGVRSISLAGYLVAMVLPVTVIVIVVQCFRRYPRLRWAAAAAVAAAVSWGVVTQTLAPTQVLGLAQDLVTGFADAGVGTAVAALTTATAVGWAVVLVGILAGLEGTQRATAAITRHRVLFTVIAACGPLPYALLRMTWLTPWPQFAPLGAELTPQMRLWGLLLGGAALLGAAATIGLVRPWGEHFPRWMPWVAGRCVPVAAAAGPGGAVAAVLCFSAVPMLVLLTFSTGGTGVGIFTVAMRVMAALVFPFWLWGPMLALAVWGYLGHRQMTAAAPR